MPCPVGATPNPSAERFENYKSGRRDRQFEPGEWAAQINYINVHKCRQRKPGEYSGNDPARDTGAPPVPFQDNSAERAEKNQWHGERQEDTQDQG